MASKQKLTRLLLQSRTVALQVTALARHLLLARLKPIKATRVNSSSYISEWRKGGFRYLKLKEILPDFLAPSPMRAFFLGVRGLGGKSRLINPFTPFQREYVIAATTEEVVVIRVKRPGVFRAAIDRVVFRGSPDEGDLRWEGSRLSIAGKSYQPISFHKGDAEDLAGPFAPKPK